MHGLLALLLAVSSPSHPAPLTTVAEQSGWTRTGRYDEVRALCAAFPKAFPGKVRCESFGTTPEGRPMLALIASANGVLDPASAKRAHRPVMLWQGGIHAGEIDGKDAGFWLLRDLLQGKAVPHALEKVTVVFVPVFNIDGHERFSANNRPNQRGPEEMGFRTTAQNYNLNRDYTKVDSPEMAAMLRLLDAWDPILYVDLHVTDGAQFQHDVSVTMNAGNAGAKPMRELNDRIEAAVISELTAEGHLPLDFYPSFVKEDDPASGFARGVAPARFQNTYWVLRNRFAMLVETHSWKDYPTRVKTTRDVLVSLLTHLSNEAPEWLAAAAAADKADQDPSSREVALLWENGDKVKTIDFQGYAYVREKSEISGQTWIHYDETKPQVWKIPLKDNVVPAIVVQTPEAGYLVPAAHAGWLGEKLALHGFKFQKLTKPVLGAQVEAFRATGKTLKESSFEGHVPVILKGTWHEETEDLPAGSLFVPANQPGRALLAQLLEPVAPDSFAAWGFFDTAFEFKDGMEAYVNESEARKMLAQSPALKAEFEQKLATDAAFAKDPQARLRFFAERHPSWDSRYNLYPVFRMAKAPAGLEVRTARPKTAQR